MIDIRFNNKRSRANPGSFNPYEKTCSEALEVCCKGRCRDEIERKMNSTNQNQSPSSFSEKTNSFCPGDFTGSNRKSYMVLIKIYSRSPRCHRSLFQVCGVL